MMGLWILGFVAGLAVVIACIALLKIKDINIKNSELEGELKEIEKRLSASDDAARGLGIELAALQEKLGAAITDMSVVAESNAESNTEESFLKASGLLSRGAEVAQVAAECGLPESEVKLMDALRRSKNVELDPEPLL